MKLYNTLTRKKEEFMPLEPSSVKMYSCGPTVYNFFHIGNARPFIVFDVLRRYLEYTGLGVTFVQNFTDIDDKVINRANEEGMDFSALADQYIAEYFKDAEGLGIKAATVHPSATDNIPEIIEFIKSLIDKGYAYPVDGDVYFRTLKFKDYGKLSKQPLEDLEAGARISVDERKEHAMDFALWKKAKENEPSWPSPWGEGRPGWHIECSVMANRYLGETIDIHSGGVDLTFPHHENEIAQSEAKNGCEFARFWLHNAFLNVDNQKMSKSLNNFFTVRDIAEAYGYPPIRFFMLSAHYRNPLNYSINSIEQAKASLLRLTTARDNLLYLIKGAGAENLTAIEAEILESLSNYRLKFKDAMEDDLNTADAISVIFELIRDINSNVNHESSKEFLNKALELIYELDGVLGIIPAATNESLDDEIEELIKKRDEARRSKDFKTADQIRGILTEKGVILEDTPSGVKWRRA